MDPDVEGWPFRGPGAAGVAGRGHSRVLPSAAARASAAGEKRRLKQRESVGVKPGRAIVGTTKTGEHRVGRNDSANQRVARFPASVKDSGGGRCSRSLNASSGHWF
jgi:hypothetical protein